MSTTETEQTYEPVKVHVASIGAGVGLGSSAPAPSHQRYTTHYETFVLTANDPVQCILPEDDSRKVAFVQALDNDVVIGTQGQAQAAANTVSGVPQPIGAYMPKANGSPTTVIDNNAVYAGVTTTGSNSRVSVMATYRK